MQDVSIETVTGNYVLISYMLLFGEEELQVHSLDYFSVVAGLHFLGYSILCFYELLPFRLHM